MTENSEIVLRSGKTLNYTNIADSSPSTSNMESERQDIGNSSPQVVSQNELEEKVDGLRDELDSLKSMLNTLIKQGQEREEREKLSQSSRNREQSSSDMVTGVNRTHRLHYSTNHDSDEDNDNSPYRASPSSTSETDALLNAIQQIPQKIQKTSTSTKLLQTHVPNFKGQKEKYNEFEHLLLNHLRPIANKLTEEEKIHFFQSLLREDAIEFWQTVQVTSTTTLSDVLAIFRKEFAQEDMKEVARYKWNEAKYDPTTETFSEFLKNLKKTAKQAFGHSADQCIQMFLFGKLPVEIQQELTMANKEDASPDEIKTYLQRKYQYSQVLTTQPAAVQPFNQAAPSHYHNKAAIDQSTHPIVDAREPKRKFEGKCFYCGKVGHRKQECRAKQRDEANGIVKPDAIQRNQPADPDKPKYNPKLVCQICGYTGHSARDCRKRIPKESSTPYGKVPYQKENTDENRERRKDIKRQQRPLNQITTDQPDDENLSSESEQDFQ